MKKILLFIFLISTSFLAIAQSKKFDSLWTVYNNKNQSDSNRLKAIHAIGWSYLNIDPDTSILLAEMQLKLAKKCGLKKFECNSLNIMGAAYNIKGDYAKALGSQLKVLKIAEEMNNKLGIANCYSNMGMVYKSQSNYPKALEYFSNALKIYLEIFDKKGIAKCYNNTGIVYDLQGRYPSALKEYLKALTMYEEMGDKLGIVKCYTNIGNIYDYQLNYLKGLEYYLKALKISEEIGDNREIARCYGNMGNSYQNQNNYSKALEFQVKSLKIDEELGDKPSIAETSCNIANLLALKKEYPKSKEYFFSALRLSREVGNRQLTGICFENLANLCIQIHDYKLAQQCSDSAAKISREVGDLNTERLAYQNLSLVCRNTGRFKEAYQNYVKFKQLTDSIFNAENSKQLGDMKTNFEVEKKEVELKAKADAQELKTTEEKKRQQFVTYSVSCVLILVIIFAGIMVNRFRVTSKQKKIIEVKEKETQQQKHIIEEKHKEITDSINYAERIQRSFIATKEILDENLSDYFVLFKPKDIVSGDFYWASKLNNGNFALATADSTGHGVPGAIMSLLNITSLEKATETYTEAADILNSTRKTIIERLKKDGSEFGGKDGMDASLTVYDFKNYKLIIAAANNPVWIVRGAEIIEIKADKMPVGKHDKDSVSFSRQEVDLQVGDVVYTLTDGFPDQFGGEKGKKFMSKNLRELLAANAQLPMSEQKQLLEKTFSDWVGNLEQVDDVTLIGVRV